MLLGASLLVALASFAIIAGSASAANWPSAGQNIANSRTQPDETKITTGNVSRLAPRWEFTTHGEVTATPTVSGGVVYFPDLGGYLNAVNAKTGQLIWQKQISEYDGVAGSFARVSPVVYKNEIIVGDNFNASHTGGAHVFGINRRRVR